MGNGYRKEWNVVGCVEGVKLEGAGVGGRLEVEEVMREGGGWQRKG